MKWFENLKTATKLITAFVLVSLLMAAVGFMGLSGMKTINSNAVSMHDYNLECIKQLTTIRQNTGDIRYDVIKIIYQKNLNNQDADLKKEIAKIEGENDSIITNYEKSLLSENEKETFQKLKTDLGAYKAKYGLLIKATEENNYAWAEAEFPGLKVERANVYDDLSKLMEMNTKEADDSDNENHAIYKSSSYKIVGICIAGFLFAIIFGAVLALWISKQINKALKFAEAIGEGDFTHKIDVHTSDEIGALVKALQNAAENVKKLIGEIISSSSDISATSEELSATVEEVSSKMEVVNESTGQIAAGSQDLSSSTEEVNASVEEISASTAGLAKS